MDTGLFIVNIVPVNLFHI